MERSIHSFVIKIWLEGTDQQGGGDGWRGRITHVPGGEQQYVDDLAEISRFIVRHLEAGGLRPPVGWRMRQWLNRWKRSVTRQG